jgi:hypothetical protein
MGGRARACRVYEVVWLRSVHLRRGGVARKHPYCGRPRRQLPRLNARTTGGVHTCMVLRERNQLSHEEGRSVPAPSC